MKLTFHTEKSRSPFDAKQNKVDSTLIKLALLSRNYIAAAVPATADFFLRDHRVDTERPKPKNISPTFVAPYAVPLLNPHFINGKNLIYK